MHSASIFHIYTHSQLLCSQDGALLLNLTRDYFVQPYGGGGADITQWVAQLFHLTEGILHSSKRWWLSKKPVVGWHLWV